MSDACDELVLVVWAEIPYFASSWDDDAHAAAINEITELVYDFTEMTGLEYAAAMDNDANAQQIYRITYRQGLALFATAAAKQTEGVDMRDIMEGIGLTDAVEGVQLATSFFAASTRAGRLRITKK